MPHVEVIHFHGNRAAFAQLVNDMLKKGYALHGHMDALDGPGKWVIFKKS